MKRKVILFLYLSFSFLLYGCSNQSVPVSQPSVTSETYSNSSYTEDSKPDNYRTNEILSNVPKTPIKENNTIPPVDKPLDPKFIHYKNKVLVLMYHHIDEKESGITISPKKFKQHIQALLDNHYNIIPMERFIQFLKSESLVPPNAVVITFDDGYESFYKYAYPELKNRGLTATNFVIVSYIDKQPDPALPYLTWSEMAEMKQYGFSFYSHTYNLHASVQNEKGMNVAPLTNRLYLKSEKRLETEGEYRKRVIDDLTLANKILEEKLGNTIPLLCFPLGAYNSEVIKLAHEVGIQYLFTIQSGINTRSDIEIKRVHAGMPYITADILIRLLKKYSVENR